MPGHRDRVWFRIQSSKTVCSCQHQGAHASVMFRNVLVILDGHCWAKPFVIPAAAVPTSRQGLWIPMLQLAHPHHEEMSY